KFMNNVDSNAMLELVYGYTSERVTRTDFMHRHAMHNVYAIPAVIEMVITRYFGFAEYTHLFSLLPDFVKDPGNHLYCILSTSQLRVLLIRDKKLQVMQNYTYKKPEDVAHHLLSICRYFGVHANDVAVHLSGMIDENSALYSELY